MKIDFRILAATGLLAMASAALADTIITDPWLTSNPSPQGPITSGTYFVENDGVDLGSIDADTADGITGGTITFNGSSTLTTSFAAAVSGGDLTFNLNSTLLANTSFGIVAGTFTFKDSSFFAANAADAVAGGTFTLNENSILAANESFSVSGGALIFNGHASLNANEEDSVVGVDISLNDFSIINVDADDALCDGTTITFSDAAPGVDPGGTLTLSGHDVPLAWISSASGGLIRNQSGIAASLSLDFDTLTKTFNGTIEDGSGGGALSLTKYGDGTEVLGGTNTYTGGTTIYGGTLGLGSSGTALADDGAVDIQIGTLALGNANETIGTLSGYYDGIIDLTSGFTLTVNQAADRVYQGTLIGTGDLVKDGTGVLELSADNSGFYSGDITVADGTLRVSNFSGSVTDGTVIIGTNGTLDGYGSVANIDVKGTITPGLGDITTLAVSDTTTLDEGGTYAWDVAWLPSGGIPGSDWDLITTDTLVVSATNVTPFTVAPNSNGQLISGFDFTQNYTWTIAQATNTIAPFVGDEFAVDSSNFQNFAPGTFTIGSNGGNLLLTYTGTSSASVNYAYTTSVLGDLRSGTVDFENDGGPDLGALIVDTSGGVGGSGVLNFNGDSTLTVNSGGNIDGGTQLFYDDSSLTADTPGAILDGIQEFRDQSVFVVTGTNAIGGGIQRFYDDSQLQASAAGALLFANILLSDNSLLAINHNNATGTSTRIFMDGTGGNTPELHLQGHDTTLGRLSSPGTGALITNALGLSPVILTIEDLNDATFGGTLTDGGGGAVSLVKNGSGVLELSGNSNDYSGGTTVNDDGVLVVNNTSGSATGSGPVSIGADAALAGNGIISGAVTLDGTIVPGSVYGGPSDIARLSTGSQTWNPGAGYDWSIGAATGLAGIGYDTVAITGGLDIAATSLDPFHVAAATLDHFGDIGFMEDFDSAANYTWTIASTTTSVTNFVANKFSLELDDFVNPYTGTFAITVTPSITGDNLNIVYTGAATVPITSPYVTSLNGNISSGVRSVTAGSVTSNTAGGLSGGQQNFIGSTLHATVANAVTGGFQVFTGASTLDATAADAIHGGQQIFHDTSHLNLNTADALGQNSLQTFDDASVLNANVAFAVSGFGEQDFFDNSVLNAALANAVVGGFQSFEDNSTLYVGAANAITGGLQHFDGSAAVQFAPGGSVSGGTQIFFGISYMNANVAGAVAGGLQSFNDLSTLVAGATNAVSGAFLSFGDSSCLFADATNSVQNSSILLGDDARILVYIDNALSASNDIYFDNSGSSPGGTILLNGYNATVGVIDSATGTTSGVIQNGHASAASILTVNLGADVISTFGGVIEDGGAAALDLAKTGPGTLELTGGASTFTGGTVVSAGTLLLNNTSGSATGTDSIAVDVAGTLGGSGYATGYVLVSGTVSPGASADSIGTLHTGDQLWDDGGVYKWQINDAAGSAGTGYDQLAITGGLSFFPFPPFDGDFTIALNTLDANNAPGRLPNFNTAISRTWTIATTTTGVTDFDASDFTLDMSGFVNAYNGTFALTQFGNDLRLEYTGAPVNIINTPYSIGPQPHITSGVWTVQNPGSITAFSVGSITGGEIDYYTTGGSGLAALNPGSVTGGRHVFHNDSALQTSASGAINGAEIILQDNSDILAGAVNSLGTSDGSSSSTRITFAGANTIFYVNGKDTTVGSIQSTGAGTILNNGAFTTLTVKSNVYDSNYAGLLADGTGQLALVKAGTATLNLGGNNNYTGGTTLVAGTLGVSHNNALGYGPLTIQGGALVVNGSSAITLANAINAAASFTIKQPTDISFPSLTLSGPVTLSASITITNQTNAFLTGDIDDGVGTFGITFHGHGQTLISGNNTFSGPVTIYSAVTVGSNTALGTGTVTLKGYDGNDNGANLQAFAPTVLANNIVVDPVDFVLINASAGPLTLNGIISGPGGISTFNAVNTLTLNGNNTYQLGTGIVGSSVVAVGHDSALGTGQVVVYGGLNAVNGPRTIANSLAIGGPTFGGTDSFNFTGPVHIDFGAPVVTNVPVTFSGVVSGTQDLVKAGPETLTLSNTNTYTGQTVVSKGTLVVTGSIASSSLTTVYGDGISANGTLAGTGTVGELQIIEDGTLSPGTAAAPIGVLSSANQAWDDDGAFAFDINNATGTAGTNWDTLNITGTLAITATLAHPFVFKITTLTGTSPGDMANFSPGTRYTWLIATATIGVSGFTGDNVIFDTTGFSNPDLPTFTLSVMGNNLYLVAIPEPAEWGAMMGAALLGIALLRRRRRGVSL